MPLKMDLKVITMEEAAFYALIDNVVEHVKETHKVTEDKWIVGDDAMKRLGIF